MNILITGAAGFIGSHLIEYHLNQNNTVWGIDDFSTGTPENLIPFKNHPNFHFFKADILTFPNLEEVISECDQIYHLAAKVGVFEVIHQPERVLSVNIEGTKRILDAAIQHAKKPRILFASTSEVYGPNHANPLQEDSDLITTDIHTNRATYAISKIVGESYFHMYARLHQLPMTILRFFNTIGPRQTGQYGMVVPRFIEKALRNETISVYGSGAQTRCFIDVRDSVIFLDKIAANAHLIGQTVNVGHDQEISMMDLAKHIKTLCNSESKIELVPYEKAYGEKFIDFSVRRPDLTRLRQHIQYQPHWNLNSTLENLMALKKKNLYQTTA